MGEVKSNRDELARAMHDLDLTPSQFRILDASDGTPILSQIEATFVERPRRRWWWEDFRTTRFPVSSTYFAGGDGWKHLSEIAPSGTEAIWFVVEDHPGFILCDGTLPGVQSIIEECWYFEYYVVSKGLDWLIGENHHNLVFALGSAVTHRIPVSRDIQ